MCVCVRAFVGEIDKERESLRVRESLLRLRESQYTRTCI